VSKAREDFWRRHEALAGALGGPQLQGAGFGRTPVNEASRILRGGLMVQAYASLETFLRERVAEAMDHVSKGSAAFSRLPSGLQDIALYGALEGLRFRVNMYGLKDPRSRPMVRTETDAIASSARPSYGFSSVMFGYDRSNLSPQNIKDFLEAVGVGGGGDPWFHLTHISQRVGLGGLPLKDGVAKGYAQRNAAAHDAENQIALQDLDDFLRTSLAVALGFDALLSRAARILHDGNVSNLGSKTHLLHSEVRFRFIDPAGSGWREFREGKSRAAALHPGPDPDLSACMARARTSKEFVVVRDARSWPSRWASDDCP
jgi:hypothetical protein